METLTPCFSPRDVRYRAENRSPQTESRPAPGTRGTTPRPVNPPLPPYTTLVPRSSPAGFPIALSLSGKPAPPESSPHSSILKAASPSYSSPGTPPNSPLRTPLLPDSTAAPSPKASHRCTPPQHPPGPTPASAKSPVSPDRQTAH